MSRSTTWVLAVVCLVSYAACGGDDEVGATDSDRSCDFATGVAIDIHTGTVQTDGSVTLYGAVRFAPLIGDLAEQQPRERTVHAVYVADQEVQPVANEFNFRTWSISIAADRLAAFTTTATDGSMQARLPVRAHLQGCVIELPDSEQPIVNIPTPMSVDGGT